VQLAQAHIAARWFECLRAPLRPAASIPRYSRVLRRGVVELESSEIVAARSTGSPFQNGLGPGPRHAPVRHGRPVTVPRPLAEAAMTRQLGVAGRNLAADSVIIRRWADGSLHSAPVSAHQPLGSSTRPNFFWMIGFAFSGGTTWYSL
jgi:hypothetical protein